MESCRRAVKLRLYHHPDGARIAYREAGTGAAAGAAALARASPTASWSRSSTSSRTATASCCPTCRCTAPPRTARTHPYSPEWLTEVLAGFLHDTCGPRPLVAGHGVGAQLALRATASRRDPAGEARPAAQPDAHQAARGAGSSAAGAVLVRAAVVPGVDRALARTGGARPAARAAATSLTATGRAGRARPGAPRADGPRRQRQPRPLAGPRPPAAGRAGRSATCSTPTRASSSRCCCCGPTRTRCHPLAIAEEALDLLPDAQLRVLERTGFLIAYDDPVGLARELLAFCG